jgi:hypothetical protein
MIQRPLEHRHTIIRAWHGSPKWERGIEIRPHSKSRTETGYGFCMTTSADRALKYAGRNGRVILVEMEALSGLEDRRKISLAEVWKFLYEHTSKKKAKLVFDDIARLIAATQLIRPTEDTMIDPIMLSNMCLFHQALKDQNQVELVLWLSMIGIDAEVIPQSNQEDWIVLYNTSKVIRETVMRPNGKDGPLNDFPTISKQMSASTNYDNAVESIEEPCL